MTNQLCIQRIIGKAISELFDDSERDGKLFMNDEDEIAIYAFEVLGDFADGQDQDGAQFLEVSSFAKQAGSATPLEFQYTQALTLAINGWRFCTAIDHEFA